MVCRKRNLQMAGEKRKMAEIQGNSNEMMMKSWCDLPSDLLSLIKSRLFAGDYGAFNAVCSYWRSITILVRRPPPPMDSPFRCQPWLMFIQRGNGMTMLSHPLYNGFYCIDIPKLYNAKILHSKYGWLLMIVNFSIFFFNPFTREKIELPDTAHDFTSVCFNLPPTSKDCLVIGFSCGGDATTKIGLLRRGQRIWDTYEYDNASFRPGSPSPVLFNGMYYVLGIRGNIGVFDLKNQSWEIFVERFEPEFVDSLCQSYLLELDGELVAVFFSLHNQVYFYSLDLTKMVWHSRTSTGDKLLYVSYTSAFSRRATVKGMSNKIYFPIFSGKNSVFYSLRTKRFHSFDADHPNKMRELRLSTWIEPSFERHGQLIW